jgi:uncharacterized radical SAM superfamily Fe-S cluster-containing enzyme
VVKDSDIIEKTNHYCIGCKETHRAALVQENNRIYFRFQCKGKPISQLISSNAELFLQIRSKAVVNKDGYNFRWLSILEITTDCNANCPICYNDSSVHKNGRNIDPEDVEKKVLHATPFHTMYLTGGEPTTHPEILTIYKKIRKAGKRVGLLTNGIEFSKNKDLAKELKKLRSSRICLQFDTLNPDTLAKMRGYKDVSIKIKAVKNIVNAGLNLGFICVVTEQNFEEIPETIEYVKPMVSKISSIEFKIAVPEGRFEIEQNTTLTRECVLDKIIHSKVFDGVSKESFIPYPAFIPWKVNVHPDCVAMLIMVKYRSTFIPLDKLCDLEKWMDLMRKNTSPANFFSKNILPLIYFMRSASLVNIMRLTIAGLGLIFRSKKNGFLFILVEQLMNRNYIDTNRIKQCTTELTDIDGYSLPPCVYGIDHFKTKKEVSKNAR